MNGELRMSLRKWGYRFYKEPGWAVVWYLTTGTLCAVTCLILSRAGYLPWDDVTALLLGFFVPIVTYSFKEAMGWYEYTRRYGSYAVSERYLELATEYVEKERWDDALEYLNPVLFDMPDHLRALYYSAVCREHLGEREKAIEQISKYLREKPDDIEAQRLLSRVSRTQEKQAA
ncbi:tetratricopeptide repeat protein [Candidatus Thorarchaeota archaeon]|nr:MAG: tetratricopeptide repeat protein [Candidatus Thorarchaeota archaeon]